MREGSSDASSPSASVVVCAYTMKRWEDVRASIAGALAQDPRPHEIVLVVDHNDELLERARRAWPTGEVQVVPNARARGLSGARNTALDLVDGDVVVFLDDDATPTTGWLAALLAPYDEDAVVGVGGRAEPVWPRGARRPAHLVPELDWVVGCSYRGLPPGAADVRNLMGCNMSFRRSALDGLGFREDAGRIGTVPLGAEETELCIRLTQRHPEARLRLVPDAWVRHRVSPDRTTWAYLRRRSWAEGLSKAAMTGVVGVQQGLSTERT